MKAETLLPLATFILGLVGALVTEHSETAGPAIGSVRLARRSYSASRF